MRREVKVIRGDYGKKALAQDTPFQQACITTMRLLTGHLPYQTRWHRGNVRWLRYLLDSDVLMHEAEMWIDRQPRVSFQRHSDYPQPGRPRQRTYDFAIIIPPFTIRRPLPSSVRAWNNGTIPKMIASIDAAQLPILADALEEAGFEDPTILTMCRQGNPAVLWLLGVDQ